MTFPDSVSAFGRVYVPKSETFIFCWDDQNPDYGKKSRTLTYPDPPGPGYNAPAVMEYYSIRDERDRQRINLEFDPSWRWRDTIIAINGGDVRKFDYLVGPHRAQFNDTGWPRMAYLSMSGNVVNVLERVGDWCKVETLRPTDWLRARSMTKVTHPQFIHGFHCVSWEAGETVRIESTGTPRGVVVYPFVSWAGSAWVPERHIVERR